MLMTRPVVATRSSMIDALPQKVAENEKEVRRSPPAATDAPASLEAGVAAVDRAAVALLLLIAAAALLLLTHKVTNDKYAKLIKLKGQLEWAEIVLTLSGDTALTS